jgi:hypothetical protein
MILLFFVESDKMITELIEKNFASDYKRKSYPYGIDLQSVKYIIQIEKLSFQILFLKIMNCKVID